MSCSQINSCRICGNSDLVPILHLGTQALTGVFPGRKEDVVASGPLELIKCRDEGKHKYCGLVQLKQTYNLGDMYGDNYGYRSGLNPSMVKHLETRVKKILSYLELLPGDLVIDIGSNDCTLLKAYNGQTVKHLNLLGIDPTGAKFKNFYPAEIELIPEFFTASTVKNRFGGKKAKVISSIAMFYDLERPIEFMGEVYEILANDGIWVLELSYMPKMLEMGAYDTICHEHLEYYRLKQIKWMAVRSGFKIIDIEINAVNGGSFCLILAKNESYFQENEELVNRLLGEEELKGLDHFGPYEEFFLRVHRDREELLKFIAVIGSCKQTIFGYGASTKGNVLLQFCNLKDEQIPFIAEVNEEKFGHYTPGSHIPIISEKEAKALAPDYFLVLPWHFRDFVIEKEQEYLNAGGSLVFPLPTLKVEAKKSGDLRQMSRLEERA